MHGEGTVYGISIWKSKGKDCAMPWLRWLVAGLSPRRPGFEPRSVYVGFVVESSTGTGFPSTSTVPKSVSLHRGSPYSFVVWGMNNRPVGGSSSETCCHPIYINNNREGLRIYRGRWDHNNTIISRENCARIRYKLNCLTVGSTARLLCTRWLNYNRYRPLIAIVFFR
jgi:hypothetical protein